MIYYLMFRLCWSVC